MNLKHNYIPLSIPYLNGKEKEYTLRCFKDNWLSSAGPYIEKFEKSFADYLGVKFAVACSSGTSSLHLALKALNVGVGDLIIAPNLTFIATVNAIRYVNAEPILIDSDIKNWQINVEFLNSFLSKKCLVKNKKCYHKKTGKRIAALIVTHILGYSADIKAIKHVTKKYYLPIIEDAAEALGSKFNKKKLGTFGSLGCFSFNGNKLITTGSGGMLVTNSKKYASIAKHLSQQAKVIDNNYIHTDIGFNYRMSNVQASIGLAQLEDINYRLKRKKEIHFFYKKKFLGLKEISFPIEVKNSESSYWLNTIRLLQNRSKLKINYIKRQLEKEKIETRFLWQPMNISRPHKSSIYIGQENSQSLYASCISLPSSVGLNMVQQERVIKELIKILKKKN